MTIHTTLRAWYALACAVALAALSACGGASSGAAADGTASSTPAATAAATDGREQALAVVADLQPPAAPASPRLDTLTCKLAMLSWAPASDNAAVAFYQIYHDDEQYVVTVPASQLYTWIDVPEGATWNLYVNAHDTSGNVSDASPLVQAKVPRCSPDVTPPAAPASAKLDTLTCQLANLTWAPATDNVGVVRYQVFHDGEYVVTVPPTQLNTWMRVPEGATWNLSVFAHDAAGNVSDASAVVQAKVPMCKADATPPSPPANPQIDTLTCKLAQLSWGASNDNVGVVRYQIFHDDQYVVTVPAGQLSAWISVPEGATWNFNVYAHDAAGLVSDASTTVTARVPSCLVADAQAPSAPTGLRGSVTGSNATLSWAAASDNLGVTAYDIWRNGVKLASTTSLGYTDAGLAANTSYAYAVSARDAQGNSSARSTSVTLTTGSACATMVCSVTQVATDTDLPWGLVALPDGNVIYSRRDAHDIVLLNPTTGAKTTLLAAVPDAVSTGGEGGVLGLAATAGFPASDPWLYVYHSTAKDNRVVRIKLVNGLLDVNTLQVIFPGIMRNVYHNGGRLRFGPDGKLYVAVGDAQAGNYAQDLTKLAGKILRINADGTIPADNPFGTAVWSFGHRNPQGLAFDAQGRLWEQEFGNNDMDETNLIVKGGNYGWPSCEGTVSITGTGCTTPGYVAPKATYTTAEGSCSGLTVVRDAVYIACLRGQRLYRWQISGSNLVNVQQALIATFGRLRTVEPTLDGGLWLTTSNNNDADKVFKINLGQ